MRGMNGLVVILCCIAVSGLFGIFIVIRGSKGKSIQSGRLFEQELSELRLRNKEFSALITPVVSRNNQGIEFEKSGNIDEAITCYEKNIVEGQYITRHPYDRLMVLYRRLGNYDDEIRVIRSAMTIYRNDSKYSNIIFKFLVLIFLLSEYISYSSTCDRQHIINRVSFSYAPLSSDNHCTDAYHILREGCRGDLCRCF